MHARRNLSIEKTQFPASPCERVSKVRRECAEIVWRVRGECEESVVGESGWSVCGVCVCVKNLCGERV